MFPRQSRSTEDTQKNHYMKFPELSFLGFCPPLLQKRVGSALTDRSWPAIHGGLHKTWAVSTACLGSGFAAFIVIWGALINAVHLKTLKNVSDWKVRSTPLSEGLDLFRVGHFGCPEIRTLKVNRLFKVSFPLLPCCPWPVVSSLAPGVRVVGKDWRELHLSSLKKRSNCHRRVSQIRAVPLSNSCSGRAVNDHESRALSATCRRRNCPMSKQPRAAKADRVLVAAVWVGIDA